MAFVFRSQKKNSILATSIGAQSTFEEQKLKRIYKSSGSLAKGLPSLIYKTQDSTQKQNIFPDVQAHVIHHNDNVVTKYNGFKGRQFTDSLINGELNQEVDMGEIITVKKIQNQTFTKLGVNIGEKREEKDQHLRFRSPQQIKKVEVMNKNLLEVLLLKQKDKKNIELQRIGINKKEENGESKSNKFAQWKSLKKLSPMKTFQHKIDKISLQNLNIECKKSHETIQPLSNKPTKQTNLPINNIQKSLKAESNSDEEQYVDEATPGPGYYSTQNWKEKKQFRSKKKKFQKLFFSNLERFQKSPQKFQEVTYVNEVEVVNNISNNHKKSSNCQSFLSKSPKLSNTQQLSCSPPIGYYDTRQSLEHDLVRNILKSSNTNTFINRSPRRYQVSGITLPGPGAYTLDQSQQKLLQQKNLCTFSYKSNLQRKLDYHTIDEKAERSKGSGLISMHIGKNKQESLIHVKQDSIIEDLYISEPPPFMSSSERFPKIKIINKKIFEKSPTPIEKPISPKKPFNSSSQRKIDHIVGEGVGVGVYNNIKKQWEKRSYNVLFN